MRAVALSLLVLSFPVVAQESTDWQKQKCALYEDAWTRALDSIGSDDINYNFLATNENFIASGCTETIAACPQSDKEREISELLTIVMMNEGAASTFLPFRCPPAQGEL
ncbi:hypothetical protein [Devosia sediminis]|uniref:Uncharacterized protein n=1 Tax=Devosia sediminis TaxID=2798801 RepID=A0A934IVH4_9HYPH|nr:hypothetical protein [Devosia sediminis]MBJ3783538.1 hypothetical protein [Devosia sediminis]